MECRTEKFAITWMRRDRNIINMAPPYQREGGVWSLERKQLFMDSVINNFDIPKIYLHVTNQQDAGYKWAVVDGKQRMGAVLSFLDGGFALGNDFKYTGTRSCAVPPERGQKFADFHESAKELLTEVSLDFVEVRTDDEDEIEELFSRLNNGERLNAAEMRNAMHGNIPPLIRQLASDEFFTRKLKFANRRYSHFEVACKLLYLEHLHQRTNVELIADLKKRQLDKFVEDYKNITPDEANKLLTRTRAALRKISPIFDDKDEELGKQSFPQLMYLFTLYVLDKYGAEDLKQRVKSFLREFRSQRAANNQVEEERRDAELTEFGRLSQQGTNDAGSMQERRNILVRRFLKANPDVELKDTTRAFTQEERWALWQRADKKCENCRIELPELELMDADHIVPYIDGGPTSLANARSLCATCNRSRAFN